MVLAEMNESTMKIVIPSSKGVVKNNENINITSLAVNC